MTAALTAARDSLATAATHYAAGQIEAGHGSVEIAKTQALISIAQSLDDIHTSLAAGDYTIRQAADG